MAISSCKGLWPLKSPFFTAANVNSAHMILLRPFYSLEYL